MEEHGESGQTFVGMLQWIEKAQPAIVIIENVYGAPWDKKVQMFEERGYSATFLRLDTKDYYIPHTRQRGYLFAIKTTVDGESTNLKKKKKSATDSDQLPGQWQELVNKLKRVASATLDEFMLSNDDPRVLRGRVRLTAESMTMGNDKVGSAGGSRAGRVDWTKCETRHQDSRSKEMLGDKRPLTEWSDSGNTSMPSFAWNEWTNAQVHRIHDLMDINTLRLAQVGIDCTYKTMVWNLSQNVDRDTMGKLGLCQCLTPTGVPYVTNRGGPLVGEELLLLQGIPADDLLLTKESEDNLKDLAGNAMSTTVVGACTLAAILLGFESNALAATRTMSNNNNASSKIDSTGHSNLVPRSLVSISQVHVSRNLSQYDESSVGLGPVKESITVADWDSLLADGFSSSRKCLSEGAEEALSVESLVVCKQCGQTSSKVNAFPPRKYEEHYFEPLSTADKRVQPSVFRKNLMNLLPMRVNITGFNLDALNVSKEETMSDIWPQWLEYATSTVVDKDGGLLEYRFTRIVRSSIWTAVFLSRYGGRLEARISKTGVTWLLFSKPYTKEGPLKSALERPIARLQVREQRESFSLVDGEWELCLPIKSAITLCVEGVGKIVPSWCNLLGLKGEFENEFQFETLRVNLESDNTESVSSDLRLRIEGEYKILPKCGGACGSLRKKESKNGEDDTFFFLSSGRKTLPTDDAYIFASSCHRTSSGEYRETFLEIDPELEYRPLFRTCEPIDPMNLEDSSICKIEKIRAFLPGRYHILQSSRIVPFDMDDASTMMVSRPRSALSVPVHAGAWTVSPELVSCTMSVSIDEKLFLQCLKAGGILEVNLQKARRVFDEVAFATSRMSIPVCFNDGCWLDLDQSKLAIVDDQEEICQTCAPNKPHVRWTTLSKGTRTMFVPIEDGKEAAVYERRLKNRPHPWIVRLSAKSPDPTNPPEANAECAARSCLTISISCNANSLVQRGLGLFPRNSLARSAWIELASNSPNLTRRCSFEWRVVPHVDKVMPDFPKLTFTSNKKDPQAAQPPNFAKYPLRKEQLRSLHWMLLQEGTTDPFFEEEVTEAVIPCLNWRAEGKVRRPVLLRGGIIADEVSLCFAFIV